MNCEYENRYYFRCSAIAQISIERNENFLVCKITGENTLENVVGYLNDIQIAMEQLVMFQFLYGSIKISLWLGIQQDFMSFNSYMVRLKSLSGWERISSVKVSIPIWFD